MARLTPTIRNGKLFFQHDGLHGQLSVGSPAWYAWLETATSFAFYCAQGSFTARRERAGNQRGGWYWKAYSRRKGKLLHAYLGKASTLTLEHMSVIADDLAAEHHTVLADSPEIASSAGKPGRFSPVINEHEQQEALHAQLTDIIGREQETALAQELLLRSDLRLLTITGPGGVGKTRLALHVASSLAENFADGVRYVSLAPIANPALVIPTIAQALGFVEAGEQPLFSRLQAFLRDKHCLLLLDNFEQVIAAAPLLAELMSAASALKLLVTSREVLHLRIEHELVVPSLALPDLQALPDVETLSHYAAVALFIQRATVANPGFQMTEANAATVAEICLRLDGLPLAIELAAARIKLLSPHLLLIRLEHRLQVLTGGPRDAPRRQQTLRDTLDWSYDLLTPNERRMFRSLAVFVRGFRLEAAEEFCRTFHPVPSQIFEELASLIDKNLLKRLEQPNGEVRLLLLETVREYGLECLTACDEAEAIHDAHAAYYLSLAQQVEAELRKANQVEWFNRLDQEYDNVRAALSWLLEQNDVATALTMCGSLWIFWLVRDRQGEGYQWVERALAQDSHSEITLPIKARACYVAGWLADSQGLHARGTALWHEALRLYVQCNDQPGSAAVLNKLGHAYARNAPSEAHDFYEQSLKLARQCRDQYGVADALASLADEALVLSDFALARTLFDESLDLYSSLGDKRSIAYCLCGLGQVNASEGNHIEAHALLQTSLNILHEIGDRVGIAFGLIPLGMVTLYLGDFPTALTLLAESLTVSKELGNQQEIAHYLGILGEVALQQHGESEPARTLLSESLAIFRETGNEEDIASRLFSLSNIEFAQGNFVAARKLLEECVAIFRKLNNRAKTAASLYMLSHLESHKGDYAAARTFMEESVAISRQIGDRWIMSSRLSYLGLIALNEGNYAEARVLFEESVDLARQIGDQRCIAEALGVMALLPLNEGDYDTARTLLEESLAIFNEREDRYAVVYRLADLGSLAIRQGNVAQARPLIEKALNLSMQMGHRWFIASCIERLGEIAVEQGAARWAVQLWGNAAAIREAIGAPMPPIEHTQYNQAIASANTQLSAEAFSSAWCSGYSSTSEQILAAQDEPVELLPATCQLQASPGELDPTPVVLSSNGLTGRELEVLRLVALGLTNAQIAEQLVISPRTVQSHMTAIYSKTGLSSRSAATRYAIEHQLA